MIAINSLRSSYTLFILYLSECTFGRNYKQTRKNKKGERDRKIEREVYAFLFCTIDKDNLSKQFVSRLN